MIYLGVIIGIVLTLAYQWLYNKIEVMEYWEWEK